MRKRYTASKICLTAFSSLLGISVLATVICNENVTAINTAIGTSSWKKVQVEESDENTDTEYYKSDYEHLDDVIADTDKLIEEEMEEGAVLIKNENNALPLAQNAKVTTVGLASAVSSLSSSGSVAGSSATGREVTLKAGLEHAGFTVNPTAWDYYNDADVQSTYGTVRNGMSAPGPLIQKVGEVPWDVANAAFGSSISQYGDAAIMNITRVSGEGNKDVNRSGTTNTPNGDALTLSNEEMGVLRGLKALKDAGTVKKIIVLLNCTASIDLAFLNDAQYGIDACLQIQTVGTTGFNGVGDLLAGNANPSGKSNDTLWYHNDQNPTLTNQLGYEFLNPENLALHTLTNGLGGYEAHYVVYQEGIYLGYRYTETRYSDYVTNRANTGDFDYATTVSVPFGYGLSYTDFSYSNFKVSKTSDGDYQVSVDVKNDGKVAGKDVVEVFLQKPYTEYNVENGIEASAVELVGYKKTPLIDPGDTENITLIVDDRQFASYDANTSKTYVLTPGDYYLGIGNGAHDAVNNILAAQGHTPSNTSDRMDAEGDGDLATVALTQKNLDNTTYSKSEATGKEITNLFDNSDLNKYAETKEKSPVTYITRNNWQGTVVLDSLDNNDSYTKVTMTSKMLEDFRKGYTESELKKDNVKYPTYGADNGLSLISLRQDADGNDIPYDADIWDTFLDQLTWDDTVHLLSNGMRSTAGIEGVIGKPATLDHNGPLGVTELFATNENGLAYQKGEDPTARPSTFPAAGVLASTMNSELIDRVGKMYGENCLWAGYKGIYGPAMNTHRSQYSSRNAEYYSEDGFLAGKTAASQVVGIQSKGIYAYIKHFALNDQETNRYGLSTWLNEQSFREIYLEAFQIAIEEGDAHAMMSSYNRVGTSVSAATSNLVTDWLRGEEGFDGFVVTDMYIEQAYGTLTFYTGLLKMPYAVYCGNDLVDGANVDHQFDDYRQGYGELAWRMRESAKRILYTVCHSAAMNGWDSNTRLVHVLTPYQIALIAVDSTLGVLTAASLGFFGFEYYVKNIKKKKED